MRPTRAQLGALLERCVEQIPQGNREVLVLRDVEDMSYEEIAAITGLPDGTVKSRIHRARAQLKTMVERALGEAPGKKTEPARKGGS